MYGMPDTTNLTMAEWRDITTAVPGEVITALSEQLQDYTRRFAFGIETDEKVVTNYTLTGFPVTMVTVTLKTLADTQHRDFLFRLSKGKVRNTEYDALFDAEVYAPTKYTYAQGFASYTSEYVRDVYYGLTYSRLANWLCTFARELHWGSISNRANSNGPRRGNPLGRTTLVHTLNTPDSVIEQDVARILNSVVAGTSTTRDDTTLDLSRALNIL